jgi:hypothetical protein
MNAVICASMTASMRMNAGTLLQGGRRDVARVTVA